MKFSVYSPFLMQLFCGLQPDHHQLRGIKNAGQAVKAEAAADDHGCMAQRIASPGIAGKQALVRGEKSVAKAWDTHLSAVGMAGNDQIKAAFFVKACKLRTMGEQDRVELRADTGAAGAKLFPPAITEPDGMVGVCKAVGIVYSAHLEKLSGDSHCPCSSVQHNDATGMEPPLQRLHFPGPVLMIAGNIEAGISGCQLCEKEFRPFKGDLVVSNISGQEDQIRAACFYGIQKDSLI